MLVYSKMWVNNDRIFHFLVNYSLLNGPEAGYMNKVRKVLQGWVIAQAVHPPPPPALSLSASRVRRVRRGAAEWLDKVINFSKKDSHVTLSLSGRVQPGDMERLDTVPSRFHFSSQPGCFRGLHELLNCSTVKPYLTEIQKLLLILLKRL